MNCLHNIWEDVMRTKNRRNLTLAAMGVIGVCLSGCGTTSTSKGASFGAVLGGLTGGTRGAATGAIIGGGLGYLADSAKDKQAAQEQAQREAAALEKARITDSPNTAYRPPDTNALTGSTWRVISLVSESVPPGRYASVVITFQTNSKVTTLGITPTGDAEVFVESYRLVDNVLILSGEENGEPYVVNAKISIADNQLVVVAPGLRAVLEEIQESV